MARSSYGLFGIIYEVTFKVKPLQAMSVYHKTYSLDMFDKQLPALKAQGDSIMMYLNPFENPVTGERMVFNKTAHETSGTVLAIEFFVQPNVGKGLAAHVHPYFSERVEVITGVAHYKVGQDECMAKAGDMVILPRHVPHIHPWNVGDSILHWRKTTQLDKPGMQLLLASAAFFESLYAQQGRVGASGLPKNPLQMIVLLQALQPSAYVRGCPFGLSAHCLLYWQLLGERWGIRLTIRRLAHLLGKVRAYSLTVRSLL